MICQIKNQYFYEFFLNFFSFDREITKKLVKTITESDEKVDAVI